MLHVYTLCTIYTIVLSVILFICKQDTYLTLIRLIYVTHSKRTCTPTTTNNVQDIPTTCRYVCFYRVLVQCHVLLLSIGMPLELEVNTHHLKCLGGTYDAWLCTRTL